MSYINDWILRVRGTIPGLAGSTHLYFQEDPIERGEQPSDLMLLNEYKMQDSRHIQAMEFHSIPISIHVR